MPFHGVRLTFKQECGKGFEAEISKMYEIETKRFTSYKKLCQWVFDGLMEVHNIYRLFVRNREAFDINVITAYPEDHRHYKYMVKHKKKYLVRIANHLVSERGIMSYLHPRDKAFNESACKQHMFMMVSDPSSFKYYSCGLAHTKTLDDLNDATHDHVMINTLAQPQNAIDTRGHFHLAECNMRGSYEHQVIVTSFPNENDLARHLHIAENGLAYCAGSDIEKILYHLKQKKTLWGWEYYTEGHAYYYKLVDDPTHFTYCGRQRNSSPAHTCGDEPIKITDLKEPLKVGLHTKSANKL